MAVDMKEMIAEAARKLVVEKNVKKLTVKDIVDECEITRQAFYYHFADIPELLDWVLERETKQLLQNCCVQEDPEKGLREFFMLAINAIPGIRKSMESNYGKEIEYLLMEHTSQLFEATVKKQGIKQGYTPWEQQFFFRYHTQAILGLLRYWTPEDTEHLDEIVHQVYLILSNQNRINA
ncbi:MAG: TetR/AcrR family transcriptional regulator [Fusicatenibacter sp.]|nr:TetR/AcrR family transcriptional regulator [Fusicatenibacter sp.]